MATSTSSMIQGLYVSSSISLSTFLYLTKASKPIKAPVATRTMPKIVEYPERWRRNAQKYLVYQQNIANPLINKANFSTTNPKAIMAILVLTQARKVRSFAI